MTAHVSLPNILLPTVKDPPPPSFSGHLTLWNLSAVICSIVLIIWGDQLGPPPPSTRARCHGPPPAESLNEHLLRSSVTPKCATELSCSLGLKEQLSSEWGNSFRRRLKSFTATHLIIHPGSRTTPLPGGSLKGCEKNNSDADECLYTHETAQNLAFVHYYLSWQQINLHVAPVSFSASNFNSVATLKPQWKRWWKRKGNPSCIYLLTENTLPMHQQATFLNWQSDSWHVDMILLPEQLGGPSWFFYWRL